MEANSVALERLYRHRFAGQSRDRQRLWATLTRHFFQQWVPTESVVVDLAAGHCEFINNIHAEVRIAVDLNPDIALQAAEGVRTIIAPADAIDELDDGSVDRVFISNLFEHLAREAILSTLAEVRRVLRPGGKVLILQPNIRYCAKDYWMFFDHVTALDDRALVEALHLTSFDVERCVPRFLPYSTKSRLPTNARLVKLYLRMPWAWRLLGAQAFVVARPAGTSCAGRVTRTLEHDRERLSAAQDPGLRHPATASMA